MALTRFRARARSESPARTTVEARGFTMIIDEPESLGGTNQGPTPVEYVLGALAGCMTVVGHMVAGEMDFSLSGLEFDLAGDLDTDKLLGKTTEERAGYQEIRVIVRVNADADEDTLKRWLETVKARCPVGDNLTNSTPLKMSIERFGGRE